MRSPRSLRGAITAVTVVTIMLGAMAPATARSVLEGYLAERATVGKTIAELRERRADTAAELRTLIARSTKQLRAIPGPVAAANPERFTHIRRDLLQQRRDAGRRLVRSSRTVLQRIEALQTRRRSIDAWLATWGIFETCPIRGWHSIADNFGITVRLPDVPVHRHMGNDILAYAGTPIVAPFDGYASSSSSQYGGLEVRVTGPRGYVYNAHLSSFGTLGYVRAGTVIGYVGATGDATTAHDHLEWHPYGGGAVDPYTYLSVSCGS
ncbi:MAG: peptidoglycan DD-metalloendopeptidase family protein [Actinomycetota bacterium]|nr:peptidoglycan DD-metalloendopeptidase family protein [Actinomycetota bacterium]